MDLERKLKMLKRMIITCWIVLFICFAIKMLGYNLFEIASNNETLHKICKYIDSSWIIYLLDFILFTIGNILLLLICNCKMKWKQLLLWNGVFNIYWIFKLLVGIGIISINMAIYDILDIVVLFIVLIASSKKIRLPLLTIVLMVIFTIISTVTKNINFNAVLDKSSFMVTIFSIDYYIMLTLSVLYSNKIQLKKEVK